MKRRTWLLAAAAGAGIPAALRAQQQEEAAPPDSPASIWPAGLTQLAGRFLFRDVASPGGLWLREERENQAAQSRQVSFFELPKASRERLGKAEIVISDLARPATVKAESRRSPSGRGMLRFYEEETRGKLAMKNLPGIAGDNEDRADFTGTVIYQLRHQSHSNPSVSGVLRLRLLQEPTWGAATLDYADLTAVPVGPQGKPEDEAGQVIGNARVLRAGVEIFSYVEWQEQFEGGTRRYTGAVRLVKEGFSLPGIGL